MMDAKPEIDKLVSENVNENAQKIQFIAKVELSKPQRETKQLSFSDHRCIQSME